MLTLEYLKALSDQYSEALSFSTRSISIRNKQFERPPHLMGVINLSPDSWYRESVCLNSDQAVQRGKRLVAEGAEIIDIGAESTLLHADRVEGQAQLARLLPVIEQLSQLDSLVSIETYSAQVAEACLKSGATVLNITGVQENKALYRLAADHQAGVIICYTQAANVREAENLELDEDPIPQFLEFFKRETNVASEAGVEAIWIDPGLGFYYKNLQDSSQRVRYQIQTFLNTFRLRELGWPVCHALPHAFETFGDEVRSAEGFFAVSAILGKTDLLRTHEIPKVKAVVDTLKLFDS
ncbi:MAG: dihydropteroate synthase [Verrucomicrobiota bacterium]